MIYLAYYLLGVAVCAIPGGNRAWLWPGYAVAEAGRILCYLESR